MLPAPVFSTNPKYHGEEKPNPASRQIYWGPSAFSCKPRSGQEELVNEWLIEGYPANADACPAIACFGRDKRQLEIRLHSQAN